ncbi:hypothetical protein CLAVI_000295 [Candidatus Clavichlamydia salmonicola]|uniref:hypothetical protein n=1 Tax=Candidatus Clavichlamydia salmonicola TaxID=469812 RepID=UPI001891B1AE|nr:hypothetical protein [Candidatus Clavichlamydia salmonicola]MBF5050680.1 hypothetical protein [Candidatus Clavichlamydia salmonicola]
MLNSITYSNAISKKEENFEPPIPQLSLIIEIWRKIVGDAFASHYVPANTANLRLFTSTYVSPSINYMRKGNKE